MIGTGGGPHEVLLHRLVDQVRRGLKAFILQCSSMRTPTTAYDYRRRSSPYHSRRSASPPRYRRPSPGRREDGRFSPRHPPPRDDGREGRPTYRRSRSRSRTRSHTSRPPTPRIEVQLTEPTSKASVSVPVEGAEVSPKPLSPRSQKPLDLLSEPSEVHVPKSSASDEVTPVSAVEGDVTMVDVQPPTQPRAFTVNTAIPPTQPKNFNWPPPTGPRLVPTTSGQLHPPHQPPTPQTSSAPTPTQSEPGPVIAGTPTPEEPQITLPPIEEFKLPTPSGKGEASKNLHKTVSNTQSDVVSPFLCF